MPIRLVRITMSWTQTLTDDQFARWMERLKVKPHPVLAMPTVAWVRELMAAKPNDWQAILSERLSKRQRAIDLAEADPMNYGWEFEPWEDSDRLLAGSYVTQMAYQPPAADVLAIFGGNRASKTVYSVRRGCQTAVLYPRTTLAVLSESETASIKTVQALVWYYLKPHFGQLNRDRRDEVTKIAYTQANGFTDRKLVLPNGSEIHFLTYNQEPGDYEGWEFGAPVGEYERVNEELRAAGAFIPPNIGVVADESMPLSWLKMFSRRLKFRKAKLLWSFTPVKGITPAIKELVGNSAVTLRSRPSELLPRKNLPDVPPGHMPYIRECQFPGIKAMAIYFFTMFNKFGPAPGRTYYDEVKELCAGKNSEFVERVAYGFARDSVARAFPKFGPWNIVKRKHLPTIGTNYFFTDPAGARNWASFWVRVTPAGNHYIYRDWPDAQTYGEWAVPTEREVNETQRTGWDGDVGPAQNGLGFGIVKYKQTFLECEKIIADSKWSIAERDPQHVRLLERAQIYNPDVKEFQEDIAERYIDPRAGRSEHAAEHGGTCIIEEFEEVQRGVDGVVTGPSMELIPASGVTEDEGLGLVNELLDWNQEQPLTPALNEPKLYVCEDAMQVIWTLENYTGRGGAKGACKDFADLLRYMALAKLFYVETGKAGGRAGKGF